MEVSTVAIPTEMDTETEMETETFSRIGIDCQDCHDRTKTWRAHDQDFQEMIF